MAQSWFALQAYTGREKWIALSLERAGFEHFLPTQREMRRWSDRRRAVDVPLFPGYVFCRFELDERGKAMAVPGVFRIAGCGPAPEAVPDYEIEALQKLVSSGLPLEPWPYLREGDAVRVAGGALDGLVGSFVRAKTGNRIVVSVSLLQRSVAVELDNERVWPEPAAGSRVIVAKPSRSDTGDGIRPAAGAAGGSA